MTDRCATRDCWHADNDVPCPSEPWPDVTDELTRNLGGVRYDLDFIPDVADIDDFTEVQP